ncbi:MAG TPA: FIST N-terminal domain-containing protein [Patescibacteria group bacterium]|jgi:small ligand-binding sensory domain FIST|nr:FIST N-terminal domain-containing protein [Patescibacteria group bacterium]
MIRAATGLSSGKDPIKCAEEAARSSIGRLESMGAASADAVLVFTSGEASGSFVPMLHSIRAICGTGSVAGCSGAGVLTEAGEIEGENAVAVLSLASDTMRATPFFVRDLKGRDADAGREIGRVVRPLLSDNALLVVFFDALACNPELMFGGLHEVAGPVPVVGGGAASGESSGSITHQFCGGEAMSNAVSGVVLTGAIVSSVGVTQSCLPVGRPWRVTGAKGNAIQTLDGQPAVRALIECLAGPGREISQDLHRLAPHLFVAFPSVAGREMKRGQYLVRSILGVDPDDGSVFVGRQITEGETISFALRDPDGARDDLKAMIEESVPVAGRPDIGLYFNCCARGRGLYGLPDIDTAFIHNAFSHLPLAGFFGYAEVASLRGRARLHNYAGVMLLVSESPSC